MAKHPSTPEPDPGPARPGGSYAVTFPGLPPVTVEATTKEDAIKKAAAKMGVNLPTETPAEVAEVP